MTSIHLFFCAQVLCAPHHFLHGYFLYFIVDLLCTHDVMLFTNISTAFHLSGFTLLIQLIVIISSLFMIFIFIHEKHDPTDCNTDQQIEHTLLEQQTKFVRKFDFLSFGSKFNFCNLSTTQNKMSKTMN